jgi:hypothetical protein
MFGRFNMIEKIDNICEAEHCMFIINLNNHNIMFIVLCMLNVIVKGFSIYIIWKLKMIIFFSNDYLVQFFDKNVLLT